MYGNIKTNEIDNPIRVIIIDSKTAIESLSFFVENVLYDIVSSSISIEETKTKFSSFFFSCL